MGIVLKELKEYRTALKVIRKKELIASKIFIVEAFEETEELIAIFAKSIVTVKNIMN